MQPRLKFLALRLISEDLRGNAFPLRRIGDQFVHDVVRVDRLNAEFVQELRDERLPARDPPCQRDSHFRWIVSTL